MSTFCNYWNKVSLIKSKIKKSKKIDSIGIGLASPEEIRRWGERRLPNGTLIGKVDKDHTVDYESLKPIEGGLFCERIFGPVEDFYCSCERKGEKNEKFCPNCEVEFTKSRVRRIRMGYIPLAVPVVHVWYLRGRPSYIANLVGKSRNSIDRLAYGETLSESFMGYSSLKSIYNKEATKSAAQLRKPVLSEGLATLGDYPANLLAFPPEGTSEAELRSANPSGVKRQTSSNPSGAERQTSAAWGGLPCEAKEVQFSGGELLQNDIKDVIEDDTSFSSSVSLMPNQDFTIPKRLSYSAAEPATKMSQRSLGDQDDVVMEGVRTPLQRSATCATGGSGKEALMTKSIALDNKASSGLAQLGKVSHDKEKYLKCHTLPLFSTFVYKEWSHRFSFLEYFIWSARNNDLVLPFYAHLTTSNELAQRQSNCVNEHNSLVFEKATSSTQGNRSERRLSGGVVNICESIRKSSINLIRNKFFLRFSNKTRSSNCSSTKIAQQYSVGVRSYSPLVLQEQKPSKINPSNAYSKGAATKMDLEKAELFSLVGTRFLQLRNKQGVLRFIKVNKDIGFLAQLHLNQLRTPREVSCVKQRSHSHICFAKDVKTFYSALTEKKDSRKNSDAKEGTWETEIEDLSFGLLRSTKMNPSGYSSEPSKMDYATPLPRRGTMTQSLEGSRVSYAFSTMQQDTESTPLNKMDTQQFPRLIELLNFTGGAALQNLLSRFDLIVLSKFLRHELKNLELKVNSLLALKILTYSQGLLLGKLAKRRSKQIRRLKLLELFQSQKSNPEWMILSVIPVLPPDLRPILRVNDDFVVASDLNRLYQTVLRRNNTIHERLDDPLPCPESGLFRQRSLQKAVDGLLENGKGGGTPLCASKRRPLVSLSHVLKGKKGLFRQHLLGKRVDYSGRSVIVVGPRLQLHECGLPKEMAIELFQPFLLHRLKVKGLATSNTTARRMIQQENPVIWHLLKQLVYEHPVLLNRAPTLHRLGIQAFQPRLVSGRAILLHPLVCNGFNADFDGDQMAVHVPLSFQARAEAWKIMWSKNNFLSPATGQPILVPSQDMVLGCYYLSVSIPRILNANVNVVSHDKAMTNSGGNIHFSGASHTPKGSRSSLQAFLNENKGQYFSNLQDSLLAYFQGRLQTHTPFWVRIDHRFARNDELTQLRKPDPEGITTQGAAPASQAQRGMRKPKSISVGAQRANNSTKMNPFQRTGLNVVDFSGRLSNEFEPQGNRRFADFSGAKPLPKSVPQSMTDYPMTPKGLGVQFSLVQFSGGNNSYDSKRNDVAIKSNHNVQYAYPKESILVELVNRPNIDNYVSLPQEGKALKLSFLKPLYGSSQEMCKTLFQNKSTNNSSMSVEANETLESPLEVRLSVDGNLANILTMFQNHYNYNATWVKQCKEESIKYMRTTAGRVVINDAVFKDF